MKEEEGRLVDLIKTPLATVGRDWAAFFIGRVQPLAQRVQGRVPGLGVGVRAGEGWCALCACVFHLLFFNITNMTHDTREKSINK
jgi:hypothetical protein